MTVQKGVIYQKWFNIICKVLTHKFTKNIKKTGPNLSGVEISFEIDKVAKFPPTPGDFGHHTKGSSPGDHVGELG